MSHIDIFDFWAGVPGNAKIHPADEQVFERTKHNFNLDCLINNIHGPLRKAPVVLLYLSPGYEPTDTEKAGDREYQQRHIEMRMGTARLFHNEEHHGAAKWVASRLKSYGSYEYDFLRDKVAVLNISPYHSKDFKDPHMLAALPSCRVTIEWAQKVLFPQAERGERVVVCMRSAKYWGLGSQERVGKSLFVPDVNRGGHMIKTELRTEIINTVQKALAIHPSLVGERR